MSNNPDFDPKAESEASLQMRIVNYVQTVYGKEVVIYGSPLSAMPFDKKGLAKKAKMMGNIAGYPDLAFNVPNELYGGLFIELKRKDVRTKKKDGTPASEHLARQFETIERLNALGNYATMENDFDIIKNIIDTHFSTAKLPSIREKALFQLKQQRIK